MKFKQFVHVLMIALFVWSFQNSTVHFGHHTFDDISKCKVCDASKNLKQSQHNTPLPEFTKSDAVKTRTHIEKVRVKVRFDQTVFLKPERLSSVAYQPNSVEPIPIGFNAMAPPYFTS